MCLWDELQIITEFILSAPALSNGLGCIFKFIVVYPLNHKPCADKYGVLLLS